MMKCPHSTGGCDRARFCSTECCLRAHPLDLPANLAKEGRWECELIRKIEATR
jgi:hypothetical protein